jgi:hypothetical protein
MAGSGNDTEGDNMT